MRVHPARAFITSTLPYPFEIACLEQFELCLNAFRRVKDNWTQLTVGSLTNQSTASSCPSSGCAQLVAASRPIPPGTVVARFHLCLEKWSLIPFSHCKCGALHKPEITLYRSVTCIVHYREHKVGRFWIKNKRFWLGTLPTTFNPGNTIATCSKKIKYRASPHYVFYLKWILLHATTISA